MSKNIQEALGLPIMSDLLLASGSEESTVEESVPMVIDDDQVDEKRSSLEVKDHIDSQSFEKDTDGIYQEALKHAGDLMALGYNVDTRSASKIFDTAATMLKIALDASSTKRTGQLNKAKLLLEEKKTNFLTTGRSQSDGEIQTVEAKTVGNRNDIIKQLRGNTEG